VPRLSRLDNYFIVCPPKFINGALAGVVFAHAPAMSDIPVTISATFCNSKTINLPPGFDARSGMELVYVLKRE
jgi:hypothetical protein